MTPDAPGTPFFLHNLPQMLSSFAGKHFFAHIHFLSRPVVL